MFNVKLKNKWFGVPNGVNYNDYILNIPVMIEDSSIKEIKELLTPVPEEIDIYDENRTDIIAEFIGYDTLNSLDLEYNKPRVDIEESADMVTISLSKVNLKDQVAKNTEDIQANEAQTFYTAMMTDTLLEEE